jgi:hypothetical protein
LSLAAGYADVYGIRGPGADLTPRRAADPHRCSPLGCLFPRRLTLRSPRADRAVCGDAVALDTQMPLASGLVCGCVTVGDDAAFALCDSDMLQDTVDGHIRPVPASQESRREPTFDLASGVKAKAS